MAAEGLDVTDGLVIVGCSQRKRVTSGPVPALDLYEGWVVPLLRERVTGHPAARRRVLVLSARYGLMTADTPVETYDQPMTSERQRTLHHTTPERVLQHLGRLPSSEALVLTEDVYAQVLGPVPVATTHLITNPQDRHDDVHAVLNSWNWP
ncbi:DUF6884 domain-containing protein [Streptomyces sp. NPDC087440]|uniref:DUF6884 domain-containing protein n=1 Tax=Streptomyces sp. NPDC087440 TaxID=3365790 RepID=UPI00380F7C18